MNPASRHDAIRRLGGEAEHDPGVIATVADLARNDADTTVRAIAGEVLSGLQ